MTRPRSSSACRSSAGSRGAAGWRSSFDKAARRAARGTRRFGLVTAHFVPLPLIADQAIGVRLQRLGPGGAELDRRLVGPPCPDEATARGAKVISSEEFARTVMETLRAGPGPSAAGEKTYERARSWRSGSSCSTTRTINSDNSNLIFNKFVIMTLYINSSTPALPLLVIRCQPRRLVQHAPPMLAGGGSFYRPQACRACLICLYNLSE